MWMGAGIKAGLAAALSDAIAGRNSGYCRDLYLRDGRAGTLCRPFCNGCPGQSGPGGAGVLSGHGLGTDAGCLVRPGPCCGTAAEHVGERVESCARYHLAPTGNGLVWYWSENHGVSGGFGRVFSHLSECRLRGRPGQPVASPGRGHDGGGPHPGHICHSSAGGHAGYFYGPSAGSGDFLGIPGTGRAVRCT